MGGPGTRLKRNRLAMHAAGLSGRRRILVIGIAVVVIAGAAWAAVAALHTGGSDSPVAGRRGRAQSLPAQNRPGPVLLVPGYGGSTSALDVLASRIRATGRSATVLTLPGTGTGSLVTDAAVLNSAVTRALAHGAPSVDVIGYSAGGVVALLWARQDDGAQRARRIITLGAPFHGTRLAAAAEALVPGACPIACQQLVPGSTLLAGLDVGSRSGLPRWLSLYTTDDVVVTPPASAQLAGAINVPVQSVCPGLVISHTQLPTEPAVMAMVLHAIGRGPLSYPSASDC